MAAAIAVYQNLLLAALKRTRRALVSFQMNQARQAHSVLVRSSIAIICSTHFSSGTMLEAPAIIYRLFLHSPVTKVHLNFRSGGGSYFFFMLSFSCKRSFFRSVVPVKRWFSVPIYILDHIHHVKDKTQTVDHYHNRKPGVKAFVLDLWKTHEPKPRDLKRPENMGSPENFHESELLIHVGSQDSADKEDDSNCQNFRALEQNNTGHVQNIESA